MTRERATPRWILALGAIVPLACTGRVAPTGAPVDVPAEPRSEPRSAPPNTGVLVGAARGSVVISEIMYHPVERDGPDEPHEFVELANRGTSTIAIGGWRLEGDVAFTIPPGASLRAGEHLVIARRRGMLLAIERYGLEPGQVLGDFTGALTNGRRGRVALLDAAGAVVDAVAYSAEAPWPIGADGLGVGVDWWPAEWGPLERHVGLGRSLERVYLDAPSDGVESWEASPLDGATPGRPNTRHDWPRAVVVEQTVASTGAGTLPVRPGEPALLQVRLSGTDGAVVEMIVELFVHDVRSKSPAIQRVPLRPAAAAWQATLPAQPENTVVRYRIRARISGTERDVSPRPTDPFRWHGYFVEAPASTRSHHLFVDPVDWGTLWTNVEPGFVKGCGLGENPACKSCEVNDAWNSTVPAVFASGGRVWDVRARYQGGKFGRLSGRKLARLPEPGPASGAERPPALGWKVKFPRYARFEGKKALRFNKRTQACSGVADIVMTRLFEAAEVPAARMRYARLHVNGGYYLYALEQEPIDEIMMERLHPGPVGDLYDANSVRWDAGPWGWGDFRLLEPFCGFTDVQRYGQTYERQTHLWKGDGDLIALLRGLHEARAAGDARLRAYLDQHFDRDQVLRYIAVINFANAWDDDYHNYALYRRADRWIVFSTDHNALLVGNWYEAATGKTLRGRTDLSFHLGREGDRDNWKGRWSFLKDAFLRAFAAEYEATLRQLAATVLAPDAVDRLVAETVGAFDVPGAALSLSAGHVASGVPCDDPTVEAGQVRAFARGRHRVLRERLGE